MSAIPGPGVVSAANTAVKNAGQTVKTAVTNGAKVVVNTAINGAKNATQALEQAPFSIKTVLLVLLGIFAIVGAVWALMNSRVYAVAKADIGNAPTPANNQAFADEMTRKLITTTDEMATKRQPILGSGEGGGRVAAGASAGEGGLAVIEPADRLFANFYVLGARLAGFLGTLASGGLYAEDRAVEFALKKGCRLFLLEIDYLERAPEVPVLVYRDEAGNNLARNVGSIGRVIRALKKYTKDQKLIGDDPLIVVLYVRRTPGETAATKESLNFMGAIAAELQSVVPYLYKKPASGMFTEADLVKQPLEDFANRVVIFTNADTTGFTGSAGATFTDARRLDHYVHARLYGGQEKGKIDGLELPKAGTAVGAKANSYEYFLTIPKNLHNADDTRNTWTMAMSPTLDKVPDDVQLDTVMEKLGVQGIVVDSFADEMGAIYAPKRFATYSYVAKPAEARLKAPASANVAPTPSNLNPNGGALNMRQ